ncbi:FUSC family protein [Bacillus sp. FJAT-45350]|uniref:FUSC family protein n=1 Tax=Bacillus sp. FJAT-45350 TaxID=2011014 RepID=UPI000BB6CF73|nr:aromatic acid exporter family protein [Bacillus sp. FJAT-45350]
MNQSKWIGRRVIKTGLAVFITAWVCNYFDLPVMFAVITAIVTTEPTAADSIKKGAIRLPAAALGAIFAIVVDMIFGHSALTYALVAMTTIVACSKLKLDNGTLIATLTAVAMIPGTSESFIIDFISRLSGTTIGIVVSTLVNFVILPPKFGPIVVHKVDSLYFQAANLLELVLKKESTSERAILLERFRALNQEIEKTLQLTKFQDEELKYRNFNENEQRSFIFLQKKLDYLQQIVFHIGNISFFDFAQHDKSLVDKPLLTGLTSSLILILKDPLHEINDNHIQLRFQLHQDVNNLPMHTMDENINRRLFFLFEIVSLEKLVNGLADVTNKERQYSLNEQTYPSYIFNRRVSYD